MQKQEISRTLSPTGRTDQPLLLGLTGQRCHQRLPDRHFRQRLTDLRFLLARIDLPLHPARTDRRIPQRRTGLRCHQRPTDLLCHRARIDLLLLLVLIGQRLRQELLDQHRHHVPIDQLDQAGRIDQLEQCDQLVKAEQESLELRDQHERDVQHAHDDQLAIVVQRQRRCQLMTAIILRAMLLSCAEILISQHSQESIMISKDCQTRAWISFITFIHATAMITMTCHTT